jgi:GNAT superfamily N-acetyltransferase
VVGATTTLRLPFDFHHLHHTFADIIQGGWLTSHDPNGDWLYGADVGVLPEYRRRGLARRLYEARHALVRRLRLRGHVAGGLLRGYGAWKARMAVDEYVARVVAGELVDPTLTAQLRCGFEVRGIIQSYVTDPSCDNKAALIVWPNPEYCDA